MVTETILLFILCLLIIIVDVLSDIDYFKKVKKPLGIIQLGLCIITLILAIRI